MMRGKAEDRELSGDELDKPKERDWTLKSRRVTPEGRISKEATREKQRRARRQAEKRKERGEEDEGDGIEPARPIPEPRNSPRSPKRKPKRKGQGKSARGKGPKPNPELLRTFQEGLARAAEEDEAEVFVDDEEETAPAPKRKAKPQEPKGPPPHLKGKMKPPEPKGPPPKDANLTEVGQVQWCVECSPCSLRGRETGCRKPLLLRRGAKAARPAVNRKSELFKRTVNYLRGVRPFVPTERMRRRGLVKQFKTAPQFRKRVGIRKKLLSMVPRGAAGETIVRRAWDDVSDCNSCQSRRRKTRHPADLYYKKRKAAMAKKRGIEILTDEDDYVQPGYEDTDDSDPGHRPLGKGQGAHLGVAKVPRRLLCTPLRMPIMVPRRRPPCR